MSKGKIKPPVKAAANKKEVAPAYHAGKNSAESYAQAIGAIRLEGVKSGRFLPLPDRPHEIKASPIVERVVRIGGTSDGASGAAPHPRPSVTLYHGDCTAIVPLLAEQGPPQGWIDACVTDPPYELGFMGKGWDSSGVAQRWETWGGVRIALKPGAHLVAFAGSRTYHWIAQAIDQAGFEVRDQLMWIYGSGFPKSLDVSKALDKAAGRADERGYIETTGGLHGGTGTTVGKFTGRQLSNVPVTAAAAAAAWQGWGTALKPAHEPVCFARKPLSEGTVAANVLRWATGAINVDAARTEYRDGADLAAAAAAAARIERDVPGRERWAGHGGGAFNDPKGSLEGWTEKSALGRWPANVMHDGSFEVLEAFPHHAREAIRFFYAAKASKEEREFGLAGASAVAQRANTGSSDGGRPSEPRANTHPTVKPVDLMRYLCRLVAPQGAVILDPFMGSGSTGIAAVREGMSFIGCEQGADYFEIAHARIQAAVREAEQKAAEAPSLIDEITKATAKLRQGEMF